MKLEAYFLIAVGILSGCATNTTAVQRDLTAESTNTLCREWLGNSDEGQRQAAANLLVRRGASLEKCQRLMANDRAIVTGIAIAGAAAAAGAAAHNGYGGGYSPNYGTAWDQFYGPYGSMWRCRDRATGRFVADYLCAGKPMHDATWPGPYI